MGHGADYTGVVEEGRTMRQFLMRFIRKVPALADHTETRISVDLKTGERTVQRIAEDAAEKAMVSADIKARIAKRTEELVDKAIEGAASRAAEWRVRQLARTMAESGPEVAEIFAAATAATGISAADLVGPRRSQPMVRPRFFTYWMFKTLRPDFSLPMIGQAFNRDHTTIMHGVRRFEARMTEQPASLWLAHPDVVALLKRERA